MWYQTSLVQAGLAKKRDTQRGLWVVLLGPDGAGKSSVIAGIGDGRSAGFPGSQTYHLRAPLLRSGEESPANCDPHAQRPRGTLISAGKLIYLLLANWMGYVVKVRPQLAQGKLILFDRYFSDCLVDPKRYRLPASCLGMAELVARLLPKPDLSVVLDAPATVLQQRKCEVTPAESERQRKDYLMRLASEPNVVVVEAARPLVDVVEDVQNCMIEFHLTRLPRQCVLA